MILAAERGEGFNVDLLEEEARGGHPVSEHVGKSEEKLQRRVESEAIEAMQKGDQFRGLAAGSFYNLQSANRLVNATLSSNRDIANKVGSGALPFAVVEHHFNSPTGYEVYLDRLHAQPYQRTTYGVRLFLLRDPQSPRGFRVQSAFPVQ